MVKSIIFDIGNVIIPDIWETVLFDAGGLSKTYNLTPILHISFRENILMT